MQDRIDEIVAQWESERPDVDARSMAVVGRIQRAAAALRPLLDEVHGESGLMGESFDVLAALRRSGAPYQLTPTELYRQMMLTSGAMTNRIDRLESAGYVVRKPDPRDRRGTLVKLTARGKALIDTALEKHVANEDRLLSALNEKELRQLSVLLRKLLIAMDDCPD
jgi:DNA-binding MarR family transcriptional regulator